MLLTSCSFETQQFNLNYEELHHSPPQTQESIDKAIKLFRIQVPQRANWPKLNKDMAERGMTTYYGLNKKLLVEIGPAAFESWALLGSTLGHELEVHCKQSFILINIKDRLGLDGTLDAERDAYQHELDDAERFGLSIEEQRQIKMTMDFYYPVRNYSNKFIIYFKPIQQN